MTTKIQTEATNVCPFNVKQNPIQLLVATLQYLCAYTKALAREEEPLDEKIPAPVICFSPNHIPYIDFSDRVNLPEQLECVSVIEEMNTGLMMACLEAELLTGDDGNYLIGHAVLFRCDDDGDYYPVTSRDYQRAKMLYTQGLDEIDMGAVKIPAIRVNPVGAPFIPVQGAGCD